MRSLQKTAMVFGAAGALVFVAFGIYAALRSGKIDEEAREVEAIVERDYRYPERHTLTRKLERRDREPRFIEWLVVTTASTWQCRSSPSAKAKGGRCVGIESSQNPSQCAETS
jgi:hypothetical protein